MVHDSLTGSILLRIVSIMAPPLPPAVSAFVREKVESAPPMSDRLQSDLRLIIWGTQADASAPGAGAAA